MFRVYPKEKTYRDLALYYNIKVFDWINYDHLEIKQNFRVEELWVMASKSKLYFQELLIIFEFLSLFSLMSIIEISLWTKFILIKYGSSNF